MRKFLPPSFFNLITLIGASISLLSFGLFVFLGALELVAPRPKPYMGTIAFVILPAIFIIGMIVSIIGVFRERFLEKHGKTHGIILENLDFNNPKTRRTVVVFSMSSLLVLTVAAFSSYQVYEYTDSENFCGETCHSVMSPEFTAYQFSPHARVGCVDCHIGSGATWFVRSKLSGAYQVYATVFNKYPRPIPTPIENLRPAQETCEQCHWPKHFFNEKLLQSEYFLSDEQNTKWYLDLLVRIGGGNVEAGPTSGIHWHMNIGNEVTYAALDSHRQEIAWVKSVTLDGKEVTYRSTELNPSEEELANARVRRMDCIDCHNRPTHIYQAPARAVNRFMSLGWIKPDLPSAKSIAVQALDADYTTQEEGLTLIKSTIEEFYKTTYPEIADSRSDAIEAMIVEVQKIYSRNYFPEMRVNWKNFIDNIGHLYYPGCFRCHDGKHVSDEGKTLSRDCNACHVILAQEIGKNGLRISLEGVEYIHPVDIGDAWKEMNCSDCHGAS